MYTLDGKCIKCQERGLGGVELHAHIYILLRDGKEVMRGTEGECWAYIHRQHSYSVHHATTQEGYAIKQEKPSQE